MCIRDSAHALTRRQEALERTLKPLTMERDRVAGQRARVVSVTVNLATERDAELRLSYQVRGPGWQPSYRATLDATKASVQLERLALVAQNSGEDWAGVQLTLSTGQPNRATQGRLPRPWTCLLYTSDAADERSSVDLGGRRIIKKKKTSKSLS